MKRYTIALAAILIISGLVFAQSEQQTRQKKHVTTHIKTAAKQETTSSNVNKPMTHEATVTKHAKSPLKEKNSLSLEKKVEGKISHHHGKQINVQEKVQKDVKKGSKENQPEVELK